MNLAPLLLVGCVAALVGFGLYRPLDVLGTAGWVVCLTVFGLATAWIRRAGRHMTAAHYLAAAVPWSLAALFIANGALDRSVARQYATVVLDTHYSRRSGIYDTLTVRSWRPGRSTETVPVGLGQGFFAPGDAVTIGVKSGALGVPWLVAVNH